MRVMILGYSGIGKTYYLASLFLLRDLSARRRFTLQHPNFEELDTVEDLSRTIVREQEGFVPSNEGLQLSPMELQRGRDWIEGITFTDVEGQAVEPGRNPPMAREILRQLPQHDALILVVKIPGDEVEFRESNRQLTQMLQFVRKRLDGPRWNFFQRNENIPLALVLSKMDLLPQAQGIRSTIKSKVAGLRAQIEQRRIAPREVERTLMAQKGEVISDNIKHLIDTKEVEDLMAIFFSWIGEDSYIPNRVFPCTSLGFDNAEANKYDRRTSVAKLKRLESYGTAASFLWTIYARFKTSRSFLGSRQRDYDADELLGDIRELHTSGQAYFDDDDPVWALRNIDNLYGHRIWYRTEEDEHVIG